MHFDKKAGNDFNEESYISCILEEDGIEIPPAAALATVNTANAAQLFAQVAQENLQQQQQQAQMHFCDVCNYSSVFKGNVVSCWIFF